MPTAVGRKSSIELAIGSEIESMDAFCRAVSGIRVSPLKIWWRLLGEFALRGSIVDVYPLDQRYPLRLDFFDTREVDSIRAFDTGDATLDGCDSMRLRIPATD